VGLSDFRAAQRRGKWTSPPHLLKSLESCPFSSEQSSVPQRPAWAWARYEPTPAPLGRSPRRHLLRRQDSDRTRLRSIRQNDGPQKTTTPHSPNGDLAAFEQVCDYEKASESSLDSFGLGCGDSSRPPFPCSKSSPLLARAFAVSQPSRRGRSCMRHVTLSPARPGDFRPLLKPHSTPHARCLNAERAARPPAAMLPYLLPFTVGEGNLPRH